ncbi:hypothetical protein QBC36DRAFT_341283 [Triangularia setosa]|uniref:Uncharacterized protein n=1 Tax=Triangularia setosa TaxID=2587417 RepID=A0AAN6VVY0_9PEZI|nr:hypothetical protein QBC36DRAFT_341283 [Podospora setosa]
MPVPLHFGTFIVAVIVFWNSAACRHKKYGTVVVLILWIMISLTALVVSIVSAACAWEAQHMVQCLLCMAVPFGLLWVKIVRYIWRRYIEQFVSFALSRLLVDSQ